MVATVNEVMSLIDKMKREQEMGLEKSKETRFDNLYWAIRMGMMSEVIDRIENLY